MNIAKLVSVQLPHLCNTPPLPPVYIYYLNTEMSICDVLHLGVQLKREEEEEGN